MNGIATYNPNTNIQVNKAEYDPTHTTTLRNNFARAMRVRFSKLRGLIRKAIVDQDCFGMQNIAIHTMPQKKAFTFPTSDDKIQAFMDWLNVQINNEILEVSEFQQLGVTAREPWTNMYISDSYKKGVQRATYEMGKAGYMVDSIAKSGGLSAVMSNPFHIDRVGLMYIRTFNDLQGITTDMAHKISRILAQGMADGDGAAVLARKLTRTISGPVGGLGITDTLGRFIPAERRAQILARTEIVRAHHSATMQTYRNWQAEGVQIQAELATAGDNRVCEQCAALDGKLYDLKDAENLIPVHPMCFIDPQIPIYTSEGWVSIGKIKVGDLVLTHKHRFRKVTTLIRIKQQKPEVTKIKFKGDLHLSLTSNHPILVYTTDDTEPIWKNAGDCTINDKIMLLGNRCKRCNKLIPYFRKYCSRTCLSLDITDKQWANPMHRKNISKKASIQLKKEYANGKRNKNTITNAANKKVRQMIKDGVYGKWMVPTFFDKIKKVTNTVEMRKMSSERMKKNNPMQDPVTRKKATDSLNRLYQEHPEKRLNTRMAKYRKSGKKTWIEKRMMESLDKLNIEYVFQYPILRYNVDFAIPNLKIVIECDGEYWHRDKVKDKIRQQNIENEGWLVLRYSGKQINQHLEIIEDELSRILCNHTGGYESVPWQIESIKKYTPKKNVTLFNFSVVEDESYIAKGVVVHNCRCIALPKRIDK